MNKEEFLIELKNQFNNIGIELTKEKLEKFYNYKEILLNWNEKINLTAITDDIEIINKHFIDSAIVDRYVNLNEKYMIDIGTGAGFPGIPLKIVNDNLKITLLDSLNKRINFLNDIIKEINLKDIQAIHGRAEEFFKSKKNREKYDIAVSRAVAPLNVLTEYMIPAVKIGGICVCMKGNNVEKEISEAKEGIRILGGRIEKIEKINIPNTDFERNLIIIKKETPTPIKYPRKPGTPSKEPL